MRLPLSAHWRARGAAGALIVALVLTGCAGGRGAPASQTPSGPHLRLTAMCSFLQEGPGGLLLGCLVPPDEPADVPMSALEDLRIANLDIRALPDGARLSLLVCREELTGPGHLVGVTGAPSGGGADMLESAASECGGVSSGSKVAEILGAGGGSDLAEALAGIGLAPGTCGDPLTNPYAYGKHENHYSLMSTMAKLAGIKTIAVAGAAAAEAWTKADGVLSGAGKAVGAGFKAWQYMETVEEFGDNLLKDAGDITEESAEKLASKTSENLQQGEQRFPANPTNAAATDALAKLSAAAAEAQQLLKDTKAANDVLHDPNATEAQKDSAKATIARFTNRAAELLAESNQALADLKIASEDAEATPPPDAEDGDGDDQRRVDPNAERACDMAAAMIAECVRVSWETFTCQELNRRLYGCVSATLILVGPDQEDTTCMLLTGFGDAELRWQFQQGCQGSPVAMPDPNSMCGLPVSAPAGAGPSACDPTVAYSDWGCPREILIPPSGPAPGGAPPFGGPPGVAPPQGPIPP